LSNKTEQLKTVLSKLPNQTLEIIRNSNIDGDTEVEEFVSFGVYKKALCNFDEFIKVKSRTDVSSNEIQIFARKFATSVEDLLNYPDRWMLSVLTKLPDQDDSNKDEQASDINEELLHLDNATKHDLNLRNNELIAIRKLIIPQYLYLMFNTLLDAGLEDLVLQHGIELVKLRNSLGDCLEPEDWKKIVRILQQASLNKLKTDVNGRK